MATVVMAMNGVLTEGTPSRNVLNYEAAIPGRVLYDMIKDGARVVLLSDDPSKDRAKAWLARERFTRYADVHCYPADSLLTPAEWRVQHVQDLIGVGHHIAFYIDSDPEAVGKALEAGVSSFLVAYSSQTPGRGEGSQRYSPWYDLIDVIEKQTMARAAKIVEEEADG